jgi:hypothetical protein
MAANWRPELPAFYFRAAIVFKTGFQHAQFGFQGTELAEQISGALSTQRIRGFRTDGSQTHGYVCC